MPDRRRHPVPRSLILSPDFAELSRARDFVAGVAREAGFSDERVFDIVLVCSEAAANAIEHAPVKGKVEVSALLYPDRLDLKIEGPGEFQTPDRLKERGARGLGLPLMAKLSDHLALFSAPEGGTLLTLTFYREGFRPARIGSPLPPGLLELFHASDLVESVFGVMPHGFAVFDDECRCVYLNDAMAAQDGRSKAELLGRPLSTDHPNDCRILPLLERAKAEGIEVKDQFQHPSEERWAEVSVVPFAGGVALLSRDVTERRRAEEAMNERDQAHRAMAEENERLYRRQLDIAESLQQALLNIPSEIGRFRVGHLYRSATEAARVGGDFYDVFEVKGGLVCVLVGDVAGHGIQAARTATLVKDVVHAFTHQSVRTHEVLRRTNALLVEKELPGFVSLFLGIMDGDTGSFRYSSAGHPQTLLRRVSGDVEALGSGSAPLGVFPEASWRPGAVDLEVGDLMLLYTDGVIEARRNGELFGEKRLERLLKRKRISVERLPHLIVDQVLAFSGGALQDDIAVLALSLTEGCGTTGLGPSFRQERLVE
jgi:PAS domain S-box-containing protein